MNAAWVESSVVSRAEGWLSAWVGDEHVMMNAETGTCISLTETGGRIWELIETPREIGELVRDLSAEFEAEPDVLQSDVTELLIRLSDEGAVRLASTS